MSRPVDARLLSRLFDQYAAGLELYAAQLTCWPQDCVQEAFVELARLPAAPADAGAWLFRVVRNRALNAARAQQRRCEHEQAAAEATRRRPARDPSEVAEIGDLLEQLSTGAREVVILRIWGQLSWQEIADVTGSSRSAVHRLYIQSLETLSNVLEPQSCPTTSEDISP